MNRNEYPNLSHFLSCYFNQDFRLDYGGPEGAIEGYLNDESNENIKKTADEISILLTKEQDEEELRKILFSLGSYYGPWLIGELNAAAWLASLAEKFYEHVYS